MASTDHSNAPRAARSGALLRTGLVAAITLAPLGVAQAYVGPGAGLSLLGALWGVIAAIGAALLFIVLWPIRRMRRRKREASQANPQTTQSHPPTDDDTPPRG